MSASIGGDAHLGKVLPLNAGKGDELMARSGFVVALAGRKLILRAALAKSRLCIMITR